MKPRYYRHTHSQVPLIAQVDKYDIYWVGGQTLTCVYGPEGHNAGLTKFNIIVDYARAGYYGNDVINAWIKMGGMDNALREFKARQAQS